MTRYFCDRCGEEKKPEQLLQLFRQKPRAPGAPIIRGDLPANKLPPANLETIGSFCERCHGAIARFAKEHPPMFLAANVNVEPAEQREPVDT